MDNLQRYSHGGINWFFIRSQFQFCYGKLVKTSFYMYTRKADDPTVTLKNRFLARKISIFPVTLVQFYISWESYYLNSFLSPNETINLFTCTNNKSKTWSQGDNTDQGIFSITARKAGKEVLAWLIATRFLTVRGVLSSPRVRFPQHLRICMCRTWQLRWCRWHPAYIKMLGQGAG